MFQEASRSKKSRKTYDCVGSYRSYHTSCKKFIKKLLIIIIKLKKAKEEEDKKKEELKKEILNLEMFVLNIQIDQRLRF